MPNPDPEEVFAYLDELRASGVTNMYGAAPYVSARFDIQSKAQARHFISEWMRTFGDASAAERAKDYEPLA